MRLGRLRKSAVCSGERQYVCFMRLYTIQISLKLPWGTRVLSLYLQDRQKQKRPLENHLPVVCFFLK